MTRQLEKRYAPPTYQPFWVRDKLWGETRPLIMGILNMTPDSFYDGGKYNSLDKALFHIEQMIGEGADIIDIGGESTRPGSSEVSDKEELKRVQEIVREARKRFQILLSIDTTKSNVARGALSEGVDIVNDISGFTQDESMINLLKEYSASCILGHIQGTPQNMQMNPVYEDVVQEVYTYFENRAELLLTSGIALNRVSLDPGIGFGKSVNHNYELLANLSYFKSLDCPITIGVSRKSFIGKTPGLENSDRLQPSVAMAIFSALQGATLLRVHDVAQTVEQLKIVSAVMEKTRPTP